MQGIDESKSTDYTSSPKLTNLPSTPVSPPSMKGRFSSDSNHGTEIARSDSQPMKPKKSGIFRFGRKKSSEKIAFSVPPKTKAEKALSANDVDGHRNSAASASSLGSGSDGGGVLTPRSIDSNGGYISPRDVNLKSVKSNSFEIAARGNGVSMMGVNSNAPAIASTSRNSAISGL